MDKFSAKNKRAIPVAIKKKQPSFNKNDMKSKTKIESRKTSQSSELDTTVKDSNLKNGKQGMANKSTLRHRSDSDSTSDKPPMDIKGPFNPEIIAKLHTGRPTRATRHLEMTKTTFRSSSENRTERRPFRHSPNADLNNKVTTLEKEKRLLEEKNNHHEKRIDILSEENSLLNGKVLSLEEKLDKCENVLQSLKVDPCSLEELLINEDELMKQRNNAMKDAMILKKLLANNLTITDSIKTNVEEILQY